MGRSTLSRAALAFLPFAAACQQSSDNTSNNTPDTLATLTEVELFSTRTSPALVRFVLADQDADPADLEIEFSLPNGVSGPATLVPGEFTVPGTDRRDSAHTGRMSLSAPSEGRVYYKLWDFAQDFETDSLVRDVVVSARAYSHGDPANPVEATPLMADLGNDSPVALLTEHALDPVLSGQVDVPLLVRDSSGDPVLATLEYQVLGAGATCEEFVPAARAGAEAASLDLTTWNGEDAAPAPTVFTWDTEAESALPPSCSLVNNTQEVRLRLKLVEILESPDDEPRSITVDLADLRVDNAPDTEEIIGGDGDDTGSEDGDGSDGDDSEGDGSSDGEEPDDDNTGDHGDEPEDGEAVDPFEAFLRRLAGAHPWLAPFLSDETFRRVILIAASINENAVAIADFDGDRDLDLLWAHTQSSRVLGFPQIAPELFAPAPAVLAATETTPEPVALAASDLDGDRDVDLLVATRGGTELLILEQVGSGVFKDEPVELRAPVQLEVARVRIADIDGDGDADILTWNARGAPMALFMQTRPGVFQYQSGRP